MKTVLKIEISPQRRKGAKKINVIPSAARNPVFHKSVFVRFLAAFWIITCGLLFMTSCEEIGPVIDLTGSFSADTTYIAADIETPQIKNVLLEEFTGVRCVNCPKAHELLDNLEAQYVTRLISLSAHSRFQSEPYEGDPSLHISQADTLAQLLEPLVAKPSGSIDRRKFPGDNLLVFTTKWTSYVSQQMAATTPVNIHIENQYNANTREFSTVITLHYTATDTLESRMTVMLLEDGIVTAQLGESGIEDHYVQNRVLRRILPSTSGMPLTISRERGRVSVRRFALTLPGDWKAENMRVIAFAHRSEGIKDVLHVSEKRVMQ